MEREREAPAEDASDTNEHGTVGRLIERAETAAAPITAALGAAVSTIPELPGARVRRLRRLGRNPLKSLPDLYPESAKARPVVVGLRSIPLDQIAGTAVGGGDQRGGDFLPLKPFRTQHWRARWQRLRKAQDELAILPPIDVLKYADRYWVVDGHNRVAAGSYANQGEIDASVTELVPMGGSRSEPVSSLEAEVLAARDVRRRTQTEGIGHPRIVDDGVERSGDQDAEEPG